MKEMETPAIRSRCPHPTKETVAQRWDSLRRRGLGSGALSLALLAIGGCADAEDGCLWETDDLLRRVRARVADDPVYCGMVFDGGDALQRDALDCFLTAPSDVGAELGVNHCIDCFAFSTYYRTAGSGIIGIHQSAARYTQEPPRRSIVTRCATLVIEQGYIRCSPPEEELYYCAEPESAWEIPPPPTYPPGREPPGSAPSSG